MRFVRTYRLSDEGGEQRTHLVNPAHDYTICGLDTAGDELVHRRQPEILEGNNHRLTCEHCQGIVRTVEEFLNRHKPTKNP